MLEGQQALLMPSFVQDLPTAIMDAQQQHRTDSTLKPHVVLQTQLWLTIYLE